MQRLQDLFREVDGDTAVVAPVGIGGIVLLAGRDVLAAKAGLTTAQIGALLDGERHGLCDRLYVADPNLGHWAAAAARLDRSPEPVDDESVVYLADDAAVARAVANDPRAVGLIVMFDLPTVTPAASGPMMVAVRETTDGPTVAATYENTASGDYPLYATLYVACRTNGGIQGAKFVTHLASGRGQRQVERAGCIPARQVLREIILTNEALGD